MQVSVADKSSQAGGPIVTWEGPRREGYAGSRHEERHGLESMTLGYTRSG